jgi:hypothetical protein
MTTNKQNFRIRRNKGIKKRLFSANGRDSNSSNNSQNVVVQNFRPKHSGVEQEMRVPQNLPPLNPLATTKSKGNSGPFKSNPDIGLHEIENMRGAVYKSKSIVKKKKKNKTRRFSKTNETPMSAQKPPQPRVKSIEGKRVMNSDKKHIGIKNLNLPVQDITFKNGGLTSSVFKPVKSSIKPQHIIINNSKIPSKTIKDFKWNDAYSSKLIILKKLTHLI